MSLGIKKGDLVEVISGSEKYNAVDKKRGRVVKIDNDKDRVLVENLNKRFKHQKPSQQNPKGGRIEKEMPLAICKVMLVCPSCEKTTRIKSRVNDKGVKSRYCMRCDADIKTEKK